VGVLNSPSQRVLLSKNDDVRSLFSTTLHQKYAPRGHSHPQEKVESEDHVGGPPQFNFFGKSTPRRPGTYISSTKQGLLTEIPGLWHWGRTQLEPSPVTADLTPCTPPQQQTFSFFLSFFLFVCD